MKKIILLLGAVVLMLLYLYWPESSHLEFQSWDIDVQPESEGNVQFTAWQVPENLIKVSLWKDGENFAENSQNQGEQDTKVGQNESGTISPPKTQGKKKRQRGKGKLPKVAPSLSKGIHLLVKLLNQRLEHISKMAPVLLTQGKMNKEVLKLFQNGNYLKAMEKMDLLASKYANDQEVVFAFQTACYLTVLKSIEKGHDLQGLKWLEKSITYRYRDYNFWLFEAIIFYRMRLYQGAALSFSNMINLTLPMDVLNVAEFYLARINHGLGRSERGLEYIEKFLQRNRNDRQAEKLKEEIIKEIKRDQNLILQQNSVVSIKYPADLAKKDWTIACIQEGLTKGSSYLFSTFGLQVEQSPLVVIYQNKKYFHSATGAPTWSSAFFDRKIRLPVDSKHLGKNSYCRYLQKMVSHEYVHYLLFMVAGGNLPIWFHEGLAQLVSGESDQSRLKTYKMFAKSGSFIPFTSLEGSFLIFEKEDAKIAYHQSLSILEYIRDRYGAAYIKEIIQAYIQKRTLEKVVQKVFNIDLTTWQKEWLFYLQKTYGGK